MASYLLYGCRVPMRRLVWYLVQSGYRFLHHRFPYNTRAWVPRVTAGPDGLLEYDAIGPDEKVVEYSLFRKRAEWPTIRPPENGNWTVQAELKARKEQSDDACCWDACVWHLPASLPDFTIMDELHTRWGCIASESGLEVRPWPLRARPAEFPWPAEFAVVIGVRFAQHEAGVLGCILKGIKHARERYLNRIQALNPEKEQSRQISNSIPKDFPKDLLPSLLDFIKTPLHHRLLAHLLKSYNNTEEVYIIP
jgi:hypothetical protein